MAEISIQEIEASAHASAIATGGHGPFSACGELYARNRKGAESKARFSISIAISDYRGTTATSHRAKNAPRPDQRSKMLCVQRVSCPESERIDYATERSGDARSQLQSESDCGLSSSYVLMMWLRFDKYLQALDRGQDSPCRSSPILLPT